MIVLIVRFCNAFLGCFFLLVAAGRKWNHTGVYSIMLRHLVLSFSWVLADYIFYHYSLILCCTAFQQGIRSSVRSGRNVIQNRLMQYAPYFPFFSRPRPQM